MAASAPTFGFSGWMPVLGSEKVHAFAVRDGGLRQDGRMRSLCNRWGPDPGEFAWEGQRAVARYAEDGMLCGVCLRVALARGKAEPGCEAQGCVCNPGAPCDETGCDGAQHDDGNSRTCTMCRREMAEMIAEGS